jgi:hypothetical protein
MREQVQPVMLQAVYCVPQHIIIPIGGVEKASEPLCSKNHCFGAHFKILNKFNCLRVYFAF